MAATTQLILHPLPVAASPLFRPVVGACRFGLLCSRPGVMNVNTAAISRRKENYQHDSFDIGANGNTGAKHNP